LRLISRAANGINNSGVIVGSYTINGVTHGYKLANGHFATINCPGAVSTTANGINSKGDIVGTCFPSAINTNHGFLLHAGVFRILNFPGAHETFANSVNNAVKVVGQADNDGFTWQSGTFHRFRAPSNATGTTALNGISNLGVMVGQVFSFDNWRAFLLSGSDLDFFQRPLALDNMAKGVNGHGDVVGCHDVSRGFLVLNPEAGEGRGDKPEKKLNFIPVNFPGASNSCTMSINYSRAIVGTYQDSSFHNHGFLAVMQ
jgi:uncharacterized membrane protein